MIVLVAIVVALVLLLVFLIRGRKQSVRLSDVAAPAPARMAEPAPEEGHGVASEMTAAIEDVVDQFVGLDAHPSGQPVGGGAGDPLIRLKGLGPKAASRLNELGVTRFDQIATWNDADVAAIDAEMGAFKGRIARDRWVDQAKLLAAGDTDAFETQFGKLGG
jgi:predicted flap endonuclease-1-like 5' DNA nuclease